MTVTDEQLHKLLEIEKMVSTYPGIPKKYQDDAAALIERILKQH